MPLPSPVLIAVAVLATAACATPGKSVEGAKIPRGGRLHLAGEPMPAPNVMPEGEVRERYREALMAEQRGREADDAGKKGEARVAYVQAADGFLAFANKHAGNNWDESFRYHAASLYEEAGRLPQAVATAETIAENTRDPMSRALAWQLSAKARVKAKDLRPLRIVPFEERKEPPSPMEPSSVWKSLTDSAREALAAPAAAGAGGEPPRRSISPAQVALVAGQAEFALDRLEPARGLLASALERAAAEPEVYAAAAPLYLRTWADAGDVPGYQAALAKVRTQAAGLAGARAPAPDGTGLVTAGAKPAEGEEDPLKAVEAADYTIRYTLAKRLVDQGRFAEAAGAFETLAGSNAGDAAAALDAAGFAYEKAGDVKKSIALRERILAEHGDSEVAASATLGLASARSRAGDHAGAARLYEAYLQRWPEGQQQCAALRNSAIAADQAEQWVEAAQRYQRFAGAEVCTKGSADTALLAHYRAARLYDYVKKKAEAKAAFQATLAVEGATSPEAQQAIADAKKRMR